MGQFINISYFAERKQENSRAHECLSGIRVACFAAGTQKLGGLEKLWSRSYLFSQPMNNILIGLARSQERHIFSLQRIRTYGHRLFPIHALQDSTFPFRSCCGRRRAAERKAERQGSNITQHNITVTQTLYTRVREYRNVSFSYSGTFPKFSNRNKPIFK